MPPSTWGRLLACPTLIVAAHPDDETIGTGGLLPRLDQPTIIHITNGAPRNPADACAAGFATSEDYARARRREVLEALHEAGIGPELTRELGITDQEAGFHLREIAESLADVLRELRPALVFTHPYEGGHPDHDATAFAVHAACRMANVPPAIIEFTSYHGREGRMEVGEFLPGGSHEITRIVLSGEACRLKRKMFDCFRSQRHVLENFPIALERFRPAPEYDFTAAPHAGQLFYERFEWGMTGERFRALARQTLAELGIGVLI